MTAAEAAITDMRSLKAVIKIKQEQDPNSTIEITLWPKVCKELETELRKVGTGLSSIVILGHALELHGLFFNKSEHEEPNENPVFGFLYNGAKVRVYSKSIK